ncbi:MAG: alpha/beta hydrolase [Bdellovibrionales bacterium]|nr:alpha/beta hydrolase [Bdellovibrionales bacterium]
MIKLTRVASLATNAPKIFIIAGGPGLSSLTLRDLDLLKGRFELIYIDLQGTNGSKYQGKKSFAEVASALADLIKKESGVKFSLGHSFGGFFAVDLFLGEAVSGLVCISTPFSKASLSSANDNYVANETPALNKAESNWSQKQDDSSFAKWLSEYGTLYFTNPKGKELLLKDKVSASFFKDNRSDVLDKESMLDSLNRTKEKKIFICGKDDKLLPPNVLKSDAQVGNFDFFEIENASHFVTVDQPEKVASLIENKLLRS